MTSEPSPATNSGPTRVYTPSKASAAVDVTVMLVAGSGRGRAYRRSGGPAGAGHRCGGASPPGGRGPAAGGPAGGAPPPPPETRTGGGPTPRSPATTAGFGGPASTISTTSAPWGVVTRGPSRFSPGGPGRRDSAVTAC